MRKVLYKKWIEGIEKPNGLPFIDNDFIDGTNCYSEEFTEGYFHVFSENRQYAIIESDGVLVDVRVDAFKFTDSPQSEKRLEIAAMAMQGLMANPDYMEIYDGQKYLLNSHALAEVALRYTDALIKQEELTRNEQ